MARTLSDYMTGKKNLPQPNGALVTKVPVFMVLPAALAAGDLLALLKVPANVRVVDFDVIAPQLDSNGAPALLHSIGVENAGGTDLATVYEAGLTFGRTANGSVSRCGTAVAAQDAGYSAERTISLKTTTIAATAALAGKTILVLLHLVG
ncbi:MAG: hypothetical protein V4614_14910 [Pseudomonadota bacterium]